MIKAALVTLLAIAISSAALVTALDKPTEGPRESVASSTPKAAAGTAAASTESLAVAIDMKDLKYAPASIRVPVGATVTWTNADVVAHTVTPADAAQWGDEGSGSDVASWIPAGGTYEKTFDKPGTYVYYCVPHASKRGDGSFSGMAGTIIVGDGAGSAAAPATSKDSASVPKTSVVPSPIAPARAQPEADGIVRLHLETVEVKGQLAEGVGYEFWTFNGTVPGPMLRVEVGDTVELTLSNAKSSAHPHSIDLHAVTGPGGGATLTQTAPGDSTTFTFKALNPGLYVYHCATPHIPTHVANGMYGLILVEPEGGLPPADREYFVVQGEFYTEGALGAAGMQAFSLDKMLSEDPEYFAFNGRVGALTGEGALQAKVGETVRLYVGVGGFVPSSFHVIGEIFDEVYSEGGSPPLQDVQTTLIPAGGAAIVDFRVEVPGNYVLVDHTLVRAIDRGAAGVLHVEGEADASVYAGTETAGSGH